MLKPTKEKLEKDAQDVADGMESFASLGRKYGYTANAVRKRMRKHGITRPKKNVKGLYDYECFNCEKRYKKYYSNRSKTKHGKSFCCNKCKFARMGRGGHLSLDN